MKLEIYSTDQTYYEHKSKLKSVFSSFGLRWNGTKSGWFYQANSVVKQKLCNKDRLLIVSGSSDFVETMKSISDLLFTDVRIEKQMESLEDFIVKRVKEEKEWCEVMGYDEKVAEYFTVKRIIDLN